MKRKPLPKFCGPYRVLGEVPDAPDWIRMMCVCGIEYTLPRRRIFGLPTSCGCRVKQAAFERAEVQRVKMRKHADRSHAGEDYCRLTEAQLDEMIAARRATMPGNDRLPARDDTRNATRIVNLVRLNKHRNSKVIF